MSAFVDNVITNAGLEVLAQVQNGAVFTPTKIVMGSGYLPVGTSMESLTDVITQEETLTISKKQIGDDGKTFIVGGVYQNSDVSEGFYFRELALYAKAVPSGQSADNVQEVLYSYGNAGDTADWMEAYTSGAVERQIDIITYIGNDANVDLTIQSSVYVTVEMINKPNGVAGLDETGKIDITVMPPDISTGGFVEMTESIPQLDRKEETLYGLILADFSGGNG